MEDASKAEVPRMPWMLVIPPRMMMETWEPMLSRGSPSKNLYKVDPLLVLNGSKSPVNGSPENVGKWGYMHLISP